MSDYEDAGKSVLPWLNEAEKVVNTLMSTPLAATVVDLQKQLDETKNLQEDIITHKQSVDRLCSTGNDLLAVEREASPNHEDIRSSLDGISQRYNALNSNVAQHEDKLQMMLERSASIEEGLEEVLRWLENMEMEDSDFPLMSENVEQMMSKNAALGKDLERRRSQLVSMRKNIENFATTADPKTVETLRKKLHQAEEKLNLMDSNFDARNETLSLVVKKLAVVENSIRKLESVLGPDGELILPLDGSAVIDYNSHDKVLEELKRLAEELSALEPSPARDQMLAKVNSKAQDIEKLQRRLKEREAQVASCQKRVDEFRTMVESLKQWLSVTENRVPVTSRAGSEALQEHRQLVASLLTEWESKGALVNDMKEHTKEMEELLISVLFAGTMADSPLDSDAAVNVNGHSVNKELASIQGDVEGVCTRYEAIGKTLNTRWGEMDMALQQTQAVVEKSDSLIKWLAGKQAEVATWNGVLWEIGAMKAEADRHKIVLMDIEDNAGRVHDLQTQLLDLLQQNRNSAEAAKWKQMLNDIEEKWSFVTQSARERQNDLEESCALLEKFQTAEGQLSQWLMEKQLLMSVLGPLSIDPNMLDNQKQQVQVCSSFLAPHLF
uniref:Dystrophin n=1 Tax=Eptatretus burgeri TaxID=7764 RepID=A0A8C4QZ93_EPTBU